MSEIEKVYQYMNDLLELEKYCYDIPYYQTKHIYNEYIGGPHGELERLIDQYEDHAKGKSLVGKLPKKLKYKYSVQIMKPEVIHLQAISSNNGIFRYI